MTHADDLRRRPTAAQVLTPLWRRQVAELRSWEVQVRDERPDAVHHLRVATRRLRSALSGLEPLLEARPTLALNSELRQVAAVLGGGRDVQAVRVQIGALLGGEDPDPVARRLYTSLAGLIDEADVESWKYTLEQLNRPSYDAFTRSLEHFADMPPWLPAADQAAEEVLRPLLADEWSRFRRSVDRTMQSAPADLEHQLHQTRKASKRARYVAESMVVVFGRKAKRLAKALSRCSSHSATTATSRSPGAFWRMLAIACRSTPERHCSWRGSRMSRREPWTPSGPSVSWRFSRSIGRSCEPGFAERRDGERGDVPLRRSEVLPGLLRQHHLVHRGPQPRAAHLEDRFLADPGERQALGLARGERQLGEHVDHGCIDIDADGLRGDGGHEIGCRSGTATRGPAGRRVAPTDARGDRSRRSGRACPTRPRPAPARTRREPRVLQHRWSRHRARGRQAPCLPSAPPPPPHDWAGSSGDRSQASKRSSSGFPLISVANASKSAVLALPPPYRSTQPRRIVEERRRRRRWRGARAG